MGNRLLNFREQSDNGKKDRRVGGKGSQETQKGMGMRKKGEQGKGKVSTLHLEIHSRKKHMVSVLYD